MDCIEKIYALLGPVPSVSTDSRSIAPGSVFFALKGENFNGNLYAVQALEKGAQAVVVDDPGVYASIQGDPRVILVGDTLEALQQVAALHRKTLGVPILAITGSNGKTTTKELISRVLSQKFRVSVTAGNLNNHIGVPLTLLAMTPQTEMGVVEMGASAQGEIAALCRIAAPDYGLITNIGRSHLEGFGGPGGVMKGKGELFDWLDAHKGTAFCFQDDLLLKELAALHPGLKTIPYAKSEAAGMETSLIGEYNRSNIAAAVAVGRYFGVGEDAIKDAVAGYRPDNHRSQRIETGRNVLIADCYNANPTSMRAAIENFIAQDAPPGLDKMLILGQMNELGDWSRDEHGAILELVAGSGIPDVYLVGEKFAEAAGGKYPDFRLFDNVEQLRVFFEPDNLPGGKYILVKGSNSIRLATLLPIL